MNVGVIIASLIIKVLNHSQGLSYIVGRYVEFFNDFYFTNFSVPSDGGRLQVTPVLTALVMLLWIMFWDLSYSIKRKELLGGFGVVALVLALVIGMQPGKAGMIYLFIGVLLLFSMDVQGVFVRGAVPVLLAISLFFTSWFFEGGIYRLSTRSQELIDWENSLDFERLDLSGLGTDFHVDAEQLDNDTPNHNGRDILYVYCSGSPARSLYLRGFYGTEYVDGNWKMDDSIYAKACKDAGYSQKETSKKISRMVQELIKHGGKGTRATYEIEYLRSIGDVAYVPYCFDYLSLDGVYTFSGDYLVSKKTMDQEMSFTGVQEGDLLTNPYEYIKYVRHTNNLEFRGWYNQVAAQYTQVPEGIDGIAQAVEVINQYVTDDNDKITLMEGSDADLNESLITNYHRHELVNLVRAYLDEVMAYSTHLSELPEGMDAVEYALTESHEGYCMHYATAATLILRELGVPVRYASGYVVRPGAFTYSEEENTYVALVEDYNAHAWIEVYYDYIGWVPVEVTARFSATSGADDFSTLEELDPNNENTDEPDDPTENPGEDTPDDPTENPGEDVPDDPTENPGEDTPDDPTENPGEDEPINPDNPDENPEEDEPDDPQTGALNDNPTEKMPLTTKQIIYILSGVGLVLLIAVLTILMVAKERQHRNYLETAVSEKEGRKAVRRMNRRIYLMLRLKWVGKVDKMPVSGYLTDVEFGELLKETFTSVSTEDWEKYMEIVKKMHYSEETISEEEMLHCYKCYKNPQMKLFSRKPRESKPENEG